MGFKAACLVLEEVGHPLHYTDITELAMESGYLKSRGHTPHNTMRAWLSVDVRDNHRAPSSRPPSACSVSKLTLPPDGSLGARRRCCILVGLAQFVRASKGL